MTPKSLLRLPEAASRPDELSGGAFASVLDDPGVTDDGGGRRHAGSSSAAARSTTTSTASEERAEHPDAGHRPHRAALPVPHRGPGGACWPAIRRVERVTWVQEEPRNMGARKFVLPKIRHLVAVPHPARRHQPAGALAPGRGLPGGARGRAGADRPRGADQLGMSTPRRRCWSATATLLAEPDDERFPISLGEGGTPAGARAADWARSWAWSASS